MATFVSISREGLEAGGSRTKSQSAELLISIVMTQIADAKDVFFLFFILNKSVHCLTSLKYNFGLCSAV